MKSLFTFLLVAVYAVASSAATTVGGGIYANTTWSASMGPYIIASNLVIFDDATLTIEPGVEILVDSNLGIEVRGRLHVLGTDEKKITIRGNTSSEYWAFWKGIVFIGTTPGAKTLQANFNHCNIYNAHTCFDLNIAYQGPYVFKNCNFDHNMNINEDGGMGGMLFDACTFRNGRNALSWFQFGGRISNCLFEYNEFAVLGSDSLINCVFRHNTVAAEPYGYTYGCEFSNNKLAVKNLFNSENNTFIHNKISNNETGMEIWSCFDNVIITHNEICGNEHYNIKMNTKNPCNLANNCWCSTDSVNIRSKIYDGYTDLNQGLVNFTPFKTICEPTSIPQPQPNAPAEMEVSVFPNPSPAGTALRLQSPADAAITDIHVVNLLGETIGHSMTPPSNSTMIQSQVNSYILELQNTEPGIYFIHMDLQNGEKAVKKISVY